MVKMRRALDHDEERMFDLVRQFPTPTPPSRRAFSDCYRARLPDPASYIGLAEIDDVLVGYISAYSHPAFYAGGQTAWVDEIFVSEAFRRKGIGTALLEACEQWATELGCVLVSLATARSGPFYLNLGYQTAAGYYKKYLL